MWTLGLVASTAIFAAYLAIFTIIARGLILSGQLWSNRLGTATAVIFFSCSVGHGIHAVHLLEGHAYADWHMALWDTLTAAVAVAYLSMRRSFGVLLRRPQLYDDLERRQLQLELAEAQAVAQVGSWSVDVETGRVSVTDELARILGVEPELAADRHAWTTNIHREDVDRVRAMSTDLLDRQVPVDLTFRVRAPGQPERVVRSRGRCEPHPVTGGLLAVGTLQDITDSHQLQSELAAAKGTLEAVLEHSPTAIYLKDRDQRLLLANRRTADIFGRPRDEVTGDSLWKLMDRDVVQALEDHDADVLAGDTPVEFEERTTTAEGDTRDWLSVKFPVRDPAGEPIGVGGISLDVTERRRDDRARSAAEERFRVAFDKAGVPMTIVGLEGDDRGRIMSANEAYARLLGRELQEVIGSDLRGWLHPDDIESSFDGPVNRLLGGESEGVEFERRYLHRDGHVVSTLVTYASFVDEHDRHVAIGQILDISERKRFEGQLRYLAEHDALTGLFNRRRLETELDRLLVHARRFGGGGAVMVLDLDGFKFVNDSLGHAAGDDLVTRLGGAIRRSVRDIDVVARTGGDEFAVVLPQAGEAEALAAAERLLTNIRRSGTVVHEHRHAQVTTSIGIALFDGAEGRVADDLLVEADIAMYDAKAAGKDRWAMYRRHEQQRERISARQDWLGRLKRAIDDEEFVLHAQPIAPLCSNGIPRFELLLRLPGSEGELITPGTFLYNAERFGLIEQIDHWVMSRAVRMLHAYAEAGEDVALAVNMSAKTLNAGGVPAHLAGLMLRFPIPAGRLVIEITETAAISNIEQARELARDVRSLGCRLALDDFGAGFATFYYLKHLDFDYVKIDGEFIRRLPSNRADQLVVRAVVDIARGLGSDTIAEFVQDDETLELLRSFGVGYAQGYHTGRPQPLALVLPAGF